MPKREIRYPSAWQKPPTDPALIMMRLIGYETEILHLRTFLRKPRTTFDLMQWYRAQVDKLPPRKYPLPAMSYRLGGVFPNNSTRYAEVLTALVQAGEVITELLPDGQKRYTLKEQVPRTGESQVPKKEPIRPF